MGVKRKSSITTERSCRRARGSKPARLFLPPLLVILISAALSFGAYAVPVTGAASPPLPTVSNGIGEYKPGETTPEPVSTQEPSAAEQPAATLPISPEDNEAAGKDAFLSSAMTFIEDNYLYLGGALIFLLLLILVIRIGRSGKKPAALKNPRAVTGSVRAAVLQNIGSYDEQEDSYYLTESADPEFTALHGVLAVVADGMGGLSNGAEVSGLVTSVFARLFLQLQADMEPSDKLMYITQKANFDVCARYGAKPGQSGSTLIAAIIKCGYISLLSVGDSRIALVRNGGLLQLNREHTYAADLDEAAARGEISYGEAAFDPQRRSLTSFIGMGELEHIDRTTKPIKLLPGDFILLMSDGVGNELTDQEIIDALSDDLDASAKRIENAVLCKKDPRQDNFTALLLRYI